MHRALNDDVVTVSLRIRPFSSQNTSTSSCIKVISKEPPVLLLLDKSQTYNFDNIFTEENDQENIYNKTVKPLVENVISGYNCTVFAYGQTGTGKTYTIGTNTDVINNVDDGLISRALDDFFNFSGESQHVELFISFIEIYNEKVFDLLGPENSGPLQVKGLTVHGYQHVRVCNTSEAQAFLRVGGKKRHTGETKQNPNSSRSHAIFTIYCNVTSSNSKTCAKLNLVDLAGSESVKKTGCQGSSFHEGININKGLLCLGQVMTALSNNSSHIPYRQSVITTILQDSLNRQNFISLIACISCNNEDAGETQQTLEFATRVRKIKNRPEFNQVILQFKKENPNLFARGLTPLKRPHSNIYETPGVFKKPRSCMPSIQEPDLQIRTTLSFDSPKSSISMSTNSVLNESNFHANLSPILQKYMTKMESNIMSKLEDVITNTLKRPTRQSIAKVKESKENCSTPTFSWDKVARVVRTELLQFTGQISRATSSPIQIGSSPNHIKGRNILDHTIDSSLNSTIADQSVNDVDLNKNSQETFKVPAILPKMKKAIYENRRSSLRLQQCNKIDRTIIASHNASPKAINVRRSVRLQEKIVNSDSSFEDSCIYLPARSVSVKNKIKPASSIAMTKKRKQQESPVSNRRKTVLDIFNKGNLKDLMKLQTVGIKTAEKIILHRQIKGKFESVSDISAVFTHLRYTNFLKENFLTKD